jgi:NAD-dependent SIR2 family protein deacetylase
MNTQRCIKCQKVYDLEFFPESEMKGRLSPICVRCEYTEIKEVTKINHLKFKDSKNVALENYLDFSKKYKKTLHKQRQLTS